MIISPYTKILVLTLCSATLFLSACGEKKRPPKTPEYRRPTTQTPEQPEVKTAENKAALALIANGKRELRQGNIKSAEWYFEEALRISPSHGPAYYWLAKSKYAKGDNSRALSLLNRAELLLKRAGDWIDKINQLRSKIQSGGNS